jgi:salicylate hydroxylase
MTHVVVAGGGIGGLAAALACRRADCHVTVLEQATAISEVGAGIQLGPNAVRILDQWGLEGPLRQVAARPQALNVLDARNGRVLGRLALGDAMVRKHGTDYLTIHRADLQQLLLQACMAAGVEVHLQAAVTRWQEEPVALRVWDHAGQVHAADALVGADGLWSVVRQQLLRDGRPVSTGHLAYRTLIDADKLPTGLPANQVSVWLGAAMHAVAYPVRGGELFNVVVIVEGDQAGDPQNWNHLASGRSVLKRLGDVHQTLHDLVDAGLEWKLWMLHGRPPVGHPQEMAQGRVALLGDASHAMRPYFAQGAAMALEDAAALGQCWQHGGGDVPQALSLYAQARWQRNARVQEKSRRNGIIFHAQGPLRWGRDLAMKLCGERLLDTPWLYGV